MKQTLLALFSSALIASGQSFPVTVTNRTPEIHAPAAWEYSHPPGYYFWTGASFGFSVVVGAMLFAMLRAAFSTSSEL